MSYGPDISERDTWQSRLTYSLIGAGVVGFWSGLAVKATLWWLQ